MFSGRRVKAAAPAQLRQQKMAATRIYYSTDRKLSTHNGGR